MLRNIFKLLTTNVIGGGGESILGIDIGSSAIKIIQARRKGGAAVLETYGELALGPYGETDVGHSVTLPVEKLTEALKDVLREARTTTKHCAISIPLASSLVMFIEMPVVDQKHLASIIPLEARKYIPVSISDVTLDWSIIPQETDSEFVSVEVESSVRADTKEHTAASGLAKQVKRIRVLLIAIHNETLERYRTVIDQVGLEASFFEIEIFSTIRAVLEQGIAPVMVLDMGASATKIFMLEHGIVKSSHIVNRGSQDLTAAIAKALGVSIAQAEEIKRGVSIRQEVSGERIAAVIPEHLNFIFSEANRVLQQYQRRYNKVVNRVVLTGGGVLLPGFLDMAARALETEVELGNPFRKLETPAFLEQMLKEAGPEFSVAAGVALRQLQEQE